MFGMRRALQGIGRLAPDGGGGRYAAVFLVLFFFSAASAWVVHTNELNILSKTFKRPDETYTLPAAAGKYLSPFGEPYPLYRVGETTRWFARLLYPFGIYYMNGRMGGAVAMEGVGWEYPGGYHLRKYFSKAAFKKRDRILWDREPNIQDFFFFMRAAFGLIAVGCFCLVLWALFVRFNLAAAALYGGLVLNGRLVFEQFNTFYSETSMFILLNLAAFLCLRFKESTHHNHKAAWLGVLSAAALSTKLTGVLVAVPLFLYVIFNMRSPGHRTVRRVEVFSLFFLSSMALINVNAGSLFDYVNQTLVNVWHYETGHSMALKVEAAWIMDELGYLVVPLFLLGMAWFAATPRRRLVPLYALGALAAFVVWSTWGFTQYFPRNMASAYVAMSLVAALCAGDLVRRIPADRPFLAKGVSAGSMAALLGCGAYLLLAMPSLHDRFFQAIRPSVESCGSTAAIGLSKKDLAALREMKKDVAVFPGVEPPYTYPGVSQRRIAFTVSNRLRGYPILKYLEKNEVSDDIFHEFGRYDCLVVYREGHTKQVTNFIAPKTHALKERVGDRFFFEKADGK